MPSVSPKKSQSQKTSNCQATEKPSGSSGTTKTKAPAGADIRGFFSQPGSSAPKNNTVAKTAKAGTGKQPITIDDSDEEVETVEKKPPSSSKATHAQKPTSSTSKHFSKTSATSKAQPIELLSDSDSSLPPPKSRSASNSRPAATKSMLSKRKVIPASDDDDEDNDVKPASKRQSLGNGRSKKVNYLESSEEEEEEEEYKPPPPQKGSGSVKKVVGAAGKGKKKNNMAMDIDDPSSEEMSEEYDDDLDEEDLKPKKNGKPTAAAKKAAGTPKTTPKKATTSTSKKATPKKADPPAKKDVPAPKKEEKEDGDAAGGEKKAFNYRAMLAARSAGPKNPGSKEIPDGAPNCLEGLTFVFTGELESLGRDEATELVKRYSGKVTSGPSGKTSYVVLGENAGASKLKTIAEKKLKTLNEDEFLELIRTRSGPVMDEKAVKNREKEEKKIAEQAKEMEKREKEEEKQRIRKEKALEGTGLAAKKTVPTSSQLWTTKYAPQSIKEMCGNKQPVQRLHDWLAAWDTNYKSGFKKPGKEGMGIYRAILISGPPGIGKTTSAHLVAKEVGYNPIELNASDARSKKLVENSTNIDNASLDGFFAGSGVKSTAVAGVRIDSKTCLIMDEVDGMSAGDRGGVGALNVLIKKTRIPMILICNDRTLQKMKPLQSTTFNMTFRRPQPNEIRSRIMSILHKEKLKVPPNVVDELIKGANSDIRQVLNMLSTFKLGKSEMDFDEGKQLLKINEKNTIMTPFTIIEKLCAPYAFSRTNKETLSEKSELYFHDFSFVPLFMQEHYIKTNPASLTNYADQEKNMKHLELLSKAADSISEGDLVDRMIHGSEQHWSLLPLHAIASTVAPAFQIYGGMRPGTGQWGPSFPQWLGQNSKQGKLQRQLTDIQIRMRLRVSGSRQEIREQYMPILASKIVLPLVKNGQEAVEETISWMDDYYLGKEDWDAFVELGVDTMNGDALLKKIPTAVKTAFTRIYNKSDHPIAFHKGDMFAASKKKIADIGPPADNEEVFEEDEPIPDEDPEEEKDDDQEVNDLTKDKLIKEVKKKGEKGKAAVKGGKKK